LRKIRFPAEIAENAEIVMISYFAGRKIHPPYYTGIPRIVFGGREREEDGGRKSGSGGNGEGESEEKRTFLKGRLTAGAS